MLLLKMPISYLLHFRFLKICIVFKLVRRTVVGTTLQQTFMRNLRCCIFTSFTEDQRGDKIAPYLTCNVFVKRLLKVTVTDLSNSNSRKAKTNINIIKGFNDICINRQDYTHTTVTKLTNKTIVSNRLGTVKGRRPGFERHMNNFIFMQL